MKKYLKYIFVLSLLLCFCFAFSSCNKLDEMRAKQGFEKDGILVVGGVDYIPMPELENGYSWNFVSDDTYESDNLCYITDEDVPVLLSEIFGNGCQFYNGRDVVFYESGYFVIKDKYDEYNSKIDYNDFDYYSLYYSVRNEKTGIYNDKIYTLSQEEKAAVDRTLENADILGSNALTDSMTNFSKGCYQTNKDGSIIKNQYSDGDTATDSYYSGDILSIISVCSETNENYTVIQKYDILYKVSEEDSKTLTDMFDRLGISDDYYYCSDCIEPEYYYDYYEETMKESAL